MYFSVFLPQIKGGGEGEMGCYCGAAALESLESSRFKQNLLISNRIFSYPNKQLGKLLN